MLSGNDSLRLLYNRGFNEADHGAFGHFAIKKALVQR
jgi:hypothetical protein